MLCCPAWHCEVEKTAQCARNETGPSLTANTIHDGSTGLNQLPAMPVNLLAILLLVGSSAPGLQKFGKKSARSHAGGALQNTSIQTSFHHTNVKCSGHL
jgi:hypothetical protein